jgi:hypothetical protein
VVAWAVVAWAVVARAAAGMVDTEAVVTAEERTVEAG